MKQSIARKITIRLEDNTLSAISSATSDAPYYEAHKSTTMASTGDQNPYLKAPMKEVLHYVNQQ